MQQHPNAPNADRLSEVLRISESNARDNSLVKQSPGKTPEATPGADNIYDISYNGEVPNLWNIKYIGLLLNYFAVGVVYGGSANILYPVLLVRNREEASFYTAASTMALIFWSYKIFFGLLSDCLPIFGLKRKPYIILGWVLCFAMLLILAFQGKDVTSFKLVIFLILANFGYVMADVAADGYVVWMAHKEPIESRGQTQSAIYIARQVGRILVAVLVGIFFSGPNMTCQGYRWDNDACALPGDADYEQEISVSSFFNSTTGILDADALAAPGVVKFANGEEGLLTTENYCHYVCPDAPFNFGLELPGYAWIIVAVNAAVVPFFFFMYEEKVVRDRFREKMSALWYILQNRAVWQIVLWTMVSNIWSSLGVNAKSNTLNYWLHLSPLMNSLLSIFEDTIFFVGLILVKKYFINTSWRILLLASFFLMLFFSCLYLLIVFDALRNPWFYVFMDVSGTFVSTANFLAGVFCIVEVSEPGYEAITYSLITTSHNMISPLVSVVNNQIGGFFDLGNKFLEMDDTHVRMQYFSAWILTTGLNFLFIPTLFLLPRQKKEARELLAAGQRSKKWAGFVMVSAIVILIYSTITSFLTLVPKVKCHRIFGGSGCQAKGEPQETRVPALILVGIVFLFSSVPVIMVWFQYYRGKNFLKSLY